MTCITNFWGKPECRFEPRYDLSAADTPGVESIRGGVATVQAWLDGYRAKTYVRDVCVKCGKTIERSFSNL